VFKQQHKIILWLENNTTNAYNTHIAKYADIRPFSVEDELRNSNLNITYDKERPLSYFSDVVRYLLLYNHGGIWFDLDILFLRTFDPIFNSFGEEICVYQWSTCNYPNGALYISIKPKSDRMKQIIEYINQRGRGFGFQEASLTFDLPVDLFVLPCSWFDPDWINNPYNIGWSKLFKRNDKVVTLKSFFNGSFAYHWHNQWKTKIEENSIVLQLINSMVLELNEYNLTNNMSKDSKTTFITFGGEAQNYVDAGKRLKYQAQRLKLFHQTILYTDKDLKTDKSFWKQHHEFFTQNKRGYGYWLWKPYFIKKTIETLQNGDILLYLDCGCELGTDKLIQLHHLFEIVKTDKIVGTFTHYEKDWNKMDLLNTLNMVEHVKQNMGEPQHQAGALLFYICDDVRELVSQWYLLGCDYHNIDDTPSLSPNMDCFREHRHDQSIFSLLTKKHQLYSKFSLHDGIYYNRNRTGKQTVI
jgi:hypothetical protein